MVLILWAVFWFAMVVAFGYAFALLYHWIRYGNIYPAVWIALPVYAVGSLLFIGAMLAGIAMVS